jgi:hypothetical protein
MILLVGSKMESGSENKITYFIFNYHYDRRKFNLEVSISAGNVVVSNVRVMLNAN